MPRITLAKPTPAKFLAIADEWDRKNQPEWAIRSVGCALFDVLRYALVNQPDEQSGVSALLREGTATILQRHKRTLATLAQQVDAGKWPGSVLGGQFQQLVFAHVSWCLGEAALGEWYVQFAMRPDARELSTKLWNEYARAMSCLTHGDAYQAQPPAKLKGLEKYWATYLTWIECFTNRQSTEAAKREVESSFKQHNADKRIHDVCMIEGSGQTPVGWNFRLCGLERYVSERAARAGEKPRD
jgi:hypothetical protein